MPATVVNSQNLVEFVQTRKAEHAEPMPPTRREVLALKKDEPAPADQSVKLDDAPKPGVKDKSADPSAKPSIKDIPEDQLPEHVRKIIGKKHREMKEATEFAEFQRLGRLTAEQRVKELEAELEKAKPAPAAEPSRAAGEKPKPEDFQNVAEYTDALTDWKIEQREAQRTQKQADDEESERAAKAAANWSTRLKSVMEENPDFESIVSAAFTPNDKPVAKAVISYIEKSEYGPHMLLHLAMNAEDLATFRSLPADEAIGFLGELKVALKAKVARKDPEPKAEPPVKKVSQAPAPVDTAQVTAEVVRKDPSQMTTDEYLAHKRAQRAQRR